MNKLPCSWADTPVDSSKWPHFKDVSVNPMPHDEVGILIGCDIAEVHWVLDQRIGKSDKPYAVKTPFGWSIRGNAAHANVIKFEFVEVKESSRKPNKFDVEESGGGNSDEPATPDAVNVIPRTHLLTEDSASGKLERRCDSRLESALPPEEMVASDCVTAPEASKSGLKRVDDARESTDQHRDMILVSAVTPLVMVAMAGTSSHVPPSSLMLDVLDRMSTRRVLK